MYIIWVEKQLVPPRLDPSRALKPILEKPNKKRRANSPIVLSDSE